ncbi:hypothetical protein E2C01_014529 [Portunus trituberculatus]|uniref:Uncharacterized protein n=1 Tax=Portunus trituberculatus TaxID=210409 RepID=A0A5B7DJ30_PORTR|nr:hypothetical protein [Portunus trituberculatus]
MSGSLCKGATRAPSPHQYWRLLDRHGGYPRRVALRHPRAQWLCRQMEGVRMCSCLALATPSYVCGGGDEMRISAWVLPTPPPHQCWPIPDLTDTGGVPQTGAMLAPAGLP